MNEDDRSDEELARQAADGDEAGFVELYRRYFPALYDFAFRITRDRDLAAAAVQASFFRAHHSLRSGEPIAPFKIQLFAITRQDLTDRLRRRTSTGTESDETFASVDASRLENPPPPGDLADLGRLTWQAAHELKMEEYVLLDLNVRQQLSDADVAAVAGSSPEGAERRIRRASETIEQNFASLLLFSRGRQECVDLDMLVGDDQWSPSTHKRIMGHARSCDTCQTTHGRFPNSSALLGALTPVSAPAGWQETILVRLLEAARGETAPAPATPQPAAPGGAPPARPPFAYSQGWGGESWVSRIFGQGGARGPLLAAVGGGLLVLVIVIAALCGAGAFNGGDGGDATPTGSPTGTAETTTPTETATVTETATPTEEMTATPQPSNTPAPPATPIPATAAPPAPPTAPPPPTDTPPLADTPTPKP